MKFAKLLAATLLCIVLDIHFVKADEIDSLLVEFDKNPTVIVGNRLMNCFAERQIADSGIVFNNHVIGKIFDFSLGCFAASASLWRQGERARMPKCDCYLLYASVEI